MIPPTQSTTNNIMYRMTISNFMCYNVHVCVVCLKGPKGDPGINGTMGEPGYNGSIGEVTDICYCTDTK